MTLDQIRESALARGVYRLVARASGMLLGLSGGYQSIFVHRSVATGELRFGQSDIDLLVVLSPSALRPKTLNRLQKETRWLKRLNPALQHLQLFRPGGIARYAELDTAWGGVERQTMWRVFGQPLTLDRLPLHPDHALRRFLIWFELYLGNMLMRGNPRNVRKMALDCWHSYAGAEGMLVQPLTTRRAMMEHLRLSEGHPLTSELERPQTCAQFVLELAQRLHESRLPPLHQLDEPLSFELTLPPFCVTRRFLVLPRADWPLERKWLTPGVILATPELLNLYQNYRNGFLHGLLPPELAGLGMSPPKPRRFLYENGYLCAHRFLLHPGFAESRIPAPVGRLDCLQSAFLHLKDGELPPPVHDVRERWVEDVSHYYLERYPGLSERSDGLQQAMEEL